LLSVVTNLGLLGVFKYYNFFAGSAASLLAGLGWAVHPTFLHVILPVGISFYTFHSLSYVIDVYHRRIKPTKDVTAFFAFVSFFPLLVAGPIIRAAALLPAFMQPRIFSRAQASDGLRQMLWGLFKKVAIADVCARLADPAFNDPAGYSSAGLATAAVLFAFQIYSDFSGYSDMAIGCAKLFGFSLAPNFLYPYFSRSIGEFWRRWHISLTTWFRDYIYYPLGGNKRGKGRTLFNTLLVFLLSGLWHGANWTFICWGAIHGMLSLPRIISGGKISLGHWPKAPVAFLNDFARMLGTFLLVVLAWIFFRAAGLPDALLFLRRMFGFHEEGITVPPGEALPLAIGILLVVEWINKDQAHGLQRLQQIKTPLLRWAIYLLLILFTCFFGGHPQNFIYFQF
jgi:D-alanyl-lipoteichoic acid acyltransferase DltB (MBOAT superfamily)